MADEDDFAHFYKKWPRKMNRVDALKAWKQTAADRPPLPKLLAAIDTMMHWRADLQQRREFVPALKYPASWIRAHGWEDEYDAPQTACDLQELALQAWNEVREACRNDYTPPPRGWSDSKTANALHAIGGFIRLQNMRTDQIGFMQREFEAQYRIAKPRAPSNVVPVNFNQSRRAVNG